jgi:hypothetical protein
MVTDTCYVGMPCRGAELAVSQQEVPDRFNRRTQCGLSAKASVYSKSSNSIESSACYTICRTWLLQAPKCAAQLTHLQSPMWRAVIFSTFRNEKGPLTTQTHDDADVQLQNFAP